MDDRPLLDPSVPAVPPVDSAGKEVTAPPMQFAANEEATGTAPPMKSAAAEIAPVTTLTLESAEKEEAHGAKVMNRIRGFFSSVAGRSSPPQGCDPSSTTAGGSSTGTNDCVIYIGGRGGAGKKGDAEATIKNGEGGETSKGLTIKNGEGGATSKDLTVGNKAQGFADGKKPAWMSRFMLPSRFGQRTGTEITGRGDCKREGFEALVESAVRLSEHWSRHSILAESAARLSDALRSFADAPNTKCKAIAATEVEAAADALTKAAASGKIEAEAAMAAHKLATDSASIVAKPRRPDPNETEAWLLCISIPGALTLLPYLHNEVPEQLQIYVTIVFGVVFSAASVAAMIIVRATDIHDLRIAAVLSRISFTCFSFLVVVFVAAALASGNLWLIGGCALLVLIGHIYAWSR